MIWNVLFSIFPTFQIKLAVNLSKIVVFAIACNYDVLQLCNGYQLRNVFCAITFKFLCFKFTLPTKFYGCNLFNGMNDTGCQFIKKCCVQLRLHGKLRLLDSEKYLLMQYKFKQEYSLSWIRALVPTQRKISMRQKGHLKDMRR